MPPRGVQYRTVIRTVRGKGYLHTMRDLTPKHAPLLRVLIGEGRAFVERAGGGRGGWREGGRGHGGGELRGASDGQEQERDVHAGAHPARHSARPWNRYTNPTDP